MGIDVGQGHPQYGPNRLPECSGPGPSTIPPAEYQVLGSLVLGAADPGRLLLSGGQMAQPPQPTHPPEVGVAGGPRAAGSPACVLGRPPPSLFEMLRAGPWVFWLRGVGCRRGLC